MPIVDFFHPSDVRFQARQVFHFELMFGQISNIAVRSDIDVTDDATARAEIAKAMGNMDVCDILDAPHPCDYDITSITPEEFSEDTESIGRYYILAHGELIMYTRGENPVTVRF